LFGGATLTFSSRAHCSCSAQIAVVARIAVLIVVSRALPRRGVALLASATFLGDATLAFSSQAGRSVRAQNAVVACTSVLIVVNQALAIDAFLALTAFRNAYITETSHVTKAWIAASGVS
jgi:hypothetical protein